MITYYLNGSTFKHRMDCPQFVQCRPTLRTQFREQKCPFVILDITLHIQTLQYRSVWQCCKVHNINKYVHGQHVLGILKQYKWNTLIWHYYYMYIYNLWLKKYLNWNIIYHHGISIHCILNYDAQYDMQGMFLLVSRKQSRNYHQPRFGMFKCVACK